MNNDMMDVNNGVTSVTISNLTFDGNRYGFGVNGKGLSCLGGNAPIYDLNLTYAGKTTTGTFTVESIDFVNAPGTALFLDGPGNNARLCRPISDKFRRSAGSRRNSGVRGRQHAAARQQRGSIQLDR